MIGIVILVLSFVISCSDIEGESNDVEIINQGMNESEDENVSDTAIDYAQHDVFVSELVPDKDQRLVNIREGDYWVQLPLESARISIWEIFTYDVERNGYVASFDLVTPIPYSISDSLSSFLPFHIVDNKIIGDYSDSISPKMQMPIFETGDFYVSTYSGRSNMDNMLIYSSDLINWHQSGVMYPWVPILLYEQNGGLFALAGRQVWDVSDPRYARLSRELKYTVMPPEFPIKPWSMRAIIYYCFNINNHLVMYTTIVAEEQSGGQYFQVINLDDFSEKSVAVDYALSGVYNYKAVEREDGWKIYHIGFDPADGIIVLDPFAPDGPEIIERLPGVNLPGAGQ